MNLKPQPIRKATQAFTMVEIAISIAVVAFALVAIMGVLPTGLTVQKENREDTIINQEGRYWLEAIRSGARGLDDITNYVESIRVPFNGTMVEFRNTPETPLTARQIVGLLSSPLQPSSATNNTNRVIARIKAITGAAVDQGGLTNETSFRYEMHVHLTPHRILPDNFVLDTYDANRRQGAYYMQQQAMIGNNLHDVRLVLRWPLYERGVAGWAAGNNRRTFRAQVAGLLNPVSLTEGGRTIDPEGGFVQPNRFSYVPPPPF